MDGHQVLQFVFSVGTAFSGGLIVGALGLGGDVVESFRGVPAVIVGFSMLLGVVLAAVIGHQRSVTASESLQRREEELKRLQAEFIQNVTHELRQPLTLLRGYVELLTDSQLGENVRRQLSSAALARTIDLVERVEVITTLQEAPHEQMKPELVDLMHLTDTALKMVWQKAHRAGVELRLDGPPDPPKVMGDAFWLLEALKQLLDNGIKFSPRGSTVSVRIRTTEDEVWVEVADQGVGIPARQLDRVFTPFCQADGSPSRRFGGVGLGLAIVQTVAKAHGGRVWVASEGQDQGSAFTLALPLPLVLSSLSANQVPSALGSSQKG